ncbi:MAG: hypothetical protein QF792_00645, partial [Phycisphaerae bacterium]|nr:hypothetical protein [Phycisphaerae bacterium]
MLGNRPHFGQRKSSIPLVGCRLDLKPRRVRVLIYLSDPPEALLRKAKRLYVAYRRKNKHKSRAHAAVRTALAMGDLVRRPCEICTSIGRSSD